MSLRRLDGWQPERETLHHYDDDGRLVRSVEWIESEWDEQQRGWMLALSAYEASRCQGCGGDVTETFDINNTFAYYVDAPHVCHACAAIERAMDSYSKAGHTTGASLRWIPEKR
jgi:hypothetical protein